MLNRFLILGLCLGQLASAQPGEKRTILTSGDKVHTIRYQLGQSTVLYFGMKPETVICGNKNYFHIDKIKEGITIQGVSNLTTNLTVLSQEKRFLFYLMPAGGGKSDSFVDVRWVPQSDVKPLLDNNVKLIVRNLRGQIRVGALEVLFLREITTDKAKRTILEFEVKNSGAGLVRTSEIGILAVRGKRTFTQASVFEMEELKSNATTRGRLIVTSESLKGATLTFRFNGQTAKLQGIAN